MNRKIIHKFIWIYVLIGVIGFILISTLGSQMVENCLLEINSRAIYSEAVRIASDDSILSSRVENTAEQEYILLSLQALAVYHDS